MEIREYISANRARFLEEWASLLRIPSVSCQPEHKADMMRCAERWKELLLEAGADKAEIMDAPVLANGEKGNPFVYAEKVLDYGTEGTRNKVEGTWNKEEGTRNKVEGTRNKEQGAKTAEAEGNKTENETETTKETLTVLVYGHYDVMPEEPTEEWMSNPWEAEIRDGRLYARGADDDKGQTMIQVKAFEYLVKEQGTRSKEQGTRSKEQGERALRIKFILEGEEEIGSPSLEAFIEEHKELLKCDVILVSDTSMIGKETPSITTGLRGLAYWQIEVDGPNRDLHSGHFGGAVKNPINALCEMLSKVIDGNGKITIPGFYDDVLPIPDEERKMIAKIPFNEAKYKAAIDVDALAGERGYSTLERNSCRPSFDICGIWGGYMGPGSKTVLPSKAFAKVSCRLVANQDHEKISQAFAEYMQAIAPKGVRVKVKPMHGGQGYVCPIDLPAYKAAEKGFEVAFGKKPLAARRGGSIPIIADFERILGVKTILMGFGLEQNAIHSPNESMDLEVWENGIVAVSEFYRNLKNA